MGKRQSSNKQKITVSGNSNGRNENKRRKVDETGVKDESLVTLDQIDVEKERAGEETIGNNLVESNDNANYLKVGKLVWAKLADSREYWPGILMNFIHINLENPKKFEEVVFWFGDYRASVVQKKFIKPFETEFKKLVKVGKSTKRKQGIIEAVELLAKRVHFPLPANWTIDLDSGPVNNLLKKAAGTAEQNLDIFPEFMTDKLLKIKQNCPLLQINDNKCSERANSTAKYNKKGCINDVINKGSKVKNMCIVCTFRCSDDITCTRCCSTYCKRCITDYCGYKVWRKLNKKSSFLCFLCYSHPKTIRGVLEPHPDGRNLMESSLVPEPVAVDYVLPAIPKLKRPLRVLSLFDGISTGYYAMVKMGLKIEAYYAAEIEENAMLVSKFNFSDEITHVGDVTKLTSKSLHDILPIDLVIGGSPCNDLSRVNPARKGLLDHSGTGILFFEFHRILKEVQLAQAKYEGHEHVFWLFENVASMQTSTKTMISRFLGMPPINLNAKHVSPQERERCFWGNIPQLYGANAKLKQRGVPPSLSTYLNSQLNRVAVVDKLRTVTTNRNSLKQGPSKINPVEMGGVGDVPMVTELETIFGFPQHYTDVGTLSAVKRQQLIGKSWSVPVVETILMPLLQYFENNFSKNN